MLLFRFGDEGGEGGGKRMGRERARERGAEEGGRENCWMGLAGKAGVDIYIYAHNTNLLM